MKQNSFYKALCLAFLLVFSHTFLIAQVENDTVKFGGISYDAEKQIELEKAELGIYYQFTQNATENKKDVILKDTLLLAIGSSQSIFLDPYYKSNLKKAVKARKERSLKTRLVNTEHEYLDEVLDLVNSSSDFQEERRGDPVQIYKNR